MLEITYPLGNGVTATFSGITINSLKGQYDGGGYTMFTIQAMAKSITIQDDSFILGICVCGCGKVLPTLRTNYGYLKIRIRGHKKK